MPPIFKKTLVPPKVLFERKWRFVAVSFMWMFKILMFLSRKVQEGAYGNWQIGKIIKPNTIKY